MPQASAKAQAQKAEAKLAEIRGSFRQEQLTQMAKIQRLENDLRNARLDVQMAENSSRPADAGAGPVQESQPFMCGALISGRGRTSSLSALLPKFDESFGCGSLKLAVNASLMRDASL